MSDTAEKRTSFSDVVNILYVTAENAAFESRFGFLALKMKLKAEPVASGESGDTAGDTDAKSENGREETDPDGFVTRDYPRVFLHRAFPFENPYEYISVQDGDGNELGFIRSLDDLRAEDVPLVHDELDRKYYTPQVTKILSLNERFGFSHWVIQTETGERSFTMQDTYRNIHRVTGTHIFLTDVDGNRYDIPDVEALDRKSYRKIELYL